jgi:hypothetical protein
MLSACRLWRFASVHRASAAIGHQRCTLGRQSGSFFIRERDSMQERRLLVGKGLRPKTL